jgi:hypothetical protein
LAVQNQRRGRRVRLAAQGQQSAPTVILQGWVGDLVGTQECPGRLDTVTVVDPHELHRFAGGGQLGPDLLQVGHLGDAGATPLAPHVENQNFVLGVGDVPRRAVERRAAQGQWG